uniref:Uncharacterized protein n=1 Tax=Electrophorus electricus TaxID=8005 RepID=A0A4W4H1E7_ELEEL
MRPLGRFARVCFATHPKYKEEEEAGFPLVATDDAEGVEYGAVQKEYVYYALDSFRNEDYYSFVQFRNIIEALVDRPIDGHSEVTIKLRFMQFLSRINDGDKLSEFVKLG